MSFDVKKVKDEIVAWIRDWFEVNGKGCNAVVAISGGKDSSVVATLCVEALGKERVIGVLLPKGEQFDIDVSYASRYPKLYDQHQELLRWSGERTARPARRTKCSAADHHESSGTSADGGNLCGRAVQ